MSASAMIRQMVERGLTHDQALIALEVIEAADESRRAVKRQNDAERQRRHRSRNEVSRDVTPVTRDECNVPAPLSPSDKESSPTPPKEINSPLTPRPVAERDRFADPSIVLQGVLDGMTAKRFSDHCAQKRRPLSAETASAIVSELRKWREMGGNPFEAIELAMRKGWVSVEIEYLVNAGLKSAPTGKAVDWSSRVRAFREDGTWATSWGPKPDEAGCKAPDEVRKAAA